MPRTAFFSKEIIVQKALELVRSQGSEALSARNLSKALNCSISPLFTVFENMEEIRLAVKKAASDLFEEYVEDVTSYNPAFKEFGMRLVRFAKEDQNLFYMLFMERRTIGDEWIPKKVQECLDGIEDSFGISSEQAEFLFSQMWTYACGLAILNMKASKPLTEEEIGYRLSAQFSSQMFFLKSGGNVINVAPHVRAAGEGLEDI